MSEHQSIVEALRSDHRAIAEQLDALLAASATDDTDEARAELVMILVRHFVAEEQYLYPAVHDRLTTPVDSAVEADRRIEKQLAELEHPDLDAARVADVLGRVRDGMAEHISWQEQQFEQLVTSLPADQLRELGAGVIGAEQLAPTRPRAYAPESVPANKVLSFVEGFVDRVRDYYSGRGTN